MFHPLPLALGLRYTRAKRRNHFISFISAVSMLGIALGVTVLITVISVMNGFEQELRTRILGMVAHATVSGLGAPLQDWPRAVELAHEDPRVLGAAPYVEGEAMIQGRGVQGAILRGILPDQEGSVSEVGAKMKQGRLEDLVSGGYRIVLGAELALWLGVDVGDQVLVYVPEFRSTPIGSLPQVRRFTVSGIFEVGAQQYDLGMALVHMEDAQRLLRMGSGVSGIRLKVEDMFRAWELARDLGDRMEEQLGQTVRVRDWSREHANFFRAIRTEKTVMFIILSLIVAVAAFNLVSSLVMLVTDKQADIAILRTLGLTPAQVMAAFVVQGTLIGVIGIAAGLGGGIALTLNLQRVVGALERTFGFEALPADVYYISGGIPTLLRQEDVLTIAVIAFVLCMLATVYPAWRASRVDPAAALRYE
ncbi:MAG: cell division protein FtsX [Lysobacteraceae bacterium]|nr:MAG: cell division protein FtsX [Xanthomonadaceae bacterium]